LRFGRDQALLMPPNASEFDIAGRRDTRGAPAVRDEASID